VLVLVGNTCYQNSFLQSLYLTKELRQRVLAAALVPHARCDPKRKEIAAAPATNGNNEKKDNKPMDDHDKER
jgi:ubiquitin C-terminal hydrolase